jgi:hypothetical protein
MKTKFPKKTDVNKTGNKLIEFQDWKEILFAVMEGNVTRPSVKFQIR